MRLGFAIHSQSHADNLIPIMNNCSRLGIGWIQCVLPLSVATNTDSRLIAGHPDLLDYKKVPEIIKTLKQEGYNVLLSAHVHSIYSGGAKPEWWSGYLNPSDPILFFDGLKEHIVPLLDTGIDALCIGVEADATVYYLPSWVRLKNLLSARTNIPIMYACNGWQAVSEKYRDKISSWLIWQAIANWLWRSGDPYKLLADKVLKLMGDEFYIPDHLKSTLTRNLWRGRPKILNDYMDICAVNWYWSPAMNVNRFEVYDTYFTYDTELGKVNFVDCVKEFSQNKRIWATEVECLGDLALDNDYHVAWARSTFDAMKAAEVELAFLWSNLGAMRWFNTLDKLERVWV